MKKSVFFDEYYKFFYENERILKIAKFIDFYLGSTRNGVFFAFPMITIGSRIESNCNSKKNKIRVYLHIIALFLVGLMECVFLKKFLGSELTNDLTLFGWLPAIPILRICLVQSKTLKQKQSKKIRKITDLMYVFHVYLIIICRKLMHLKYYIKYIVVTGLTFVMSYCVLHLIKSIWNGKDEI